MSVAGVVLAAGASRRLGRPKQTVVLHGETLLARAIRLANEAGLSPVAAVIADAALVALVEHAGAVAVMNGEREEGIAASIRAAVHWAEAQRAEALVLMTCDQVAVTAAHLRALCETKQAPAGSAYAGRVGVPAYFPRSLFGGLLKLRGDVGARDLLRNARAVPTEALALDIDTEADVTRAQQAAL